jgi:hypothetical protein
MRDQILLLNEKLEFFISRVKKEQMNTKRGDYFTVKDDEFRGILHNFHIIIDKDIEVGLI